MPTEQPELNDNDTEQAKTRRSQTKREFDALNAIVLALKPLDADRRDKVLEAAKVMLG